jgi:hypothetical protein
VGSVNQSFSFDKSFYFDLIAWFLVICWSSVLGCYYVKHMRNKNVESGQPPAIPVAVGQQQPQGLYQNPGQA